MEPIAAVVLAAGKGTRMKSDRAKVLHEVCGRPLAYFPIRAALSLDCAKVIAVVGHQADLVEQILSQLFPGAPLTFVVQKEQLGTGHAVLTAQAALERAGFSSKGSVLLLCGDTPLVTAGTLRRLVTAKEEARSPLAFVTARPADPAGYGRVVRGDKGLPQRIVEEKDASAAEKKIGEVNAGIYLADASFLFKALGRATRDNAQAEYYLTDIVSAAAAAAREGRAGWPATIEASEEEVSGVNDRSQLARTAKLLRERRLEALMREGVSVIDPAVTYVDEGVEVGPDTVLEPLSSLRGKTRLGRGVTIGQGCVLVDMEVEDGARILPYSHLESSRIGKGATVGPFARLRPGAQVSEQAHVGNFVELKKTVLGKGSKANHLTYLGDAVIGEGVNVGAGTITCNYDGKTKSKTVIEDGAFIGSDTQLVAPVTVHKGAYVGSGTTVREDVPAGALAVSAGKQRNIEGWVEKKGKK
ncbi:MAG TPA: bifunctional UDP-N-acetylglucosamine diphosphorylase/glucosamine-1-phosphate N-acetyltransferase GlmU [Myxococcales bacterium]|nr:bifunctional UDP-N-acetylglucosamine diphosphorylase/glucosamine-1-phosphate N-acetyltransferase GlmU [Myxococcales bacterium]